MSPHDIFFNDALEVGGQVEVFEVVIEARFLINFSKFQPEFVPFLLCGHFLAQILLQILFQLKIFIILGVFK